DRGARTAGLTLAKLGRPGHSAISEQSGTGREMSEKADRVHLIGSVPLSDCEQVFRHVAGELGPYLRRLPDGETGERGRWIYFQNLMLRAHPAMEEDPTEPPFRFVQWDGKVIRETMRLRFKPGIHPDNVTFDTGYDRATKESYAVFARLR